MQQLIEKAFIYKLSRCLSVDHQLLHFPQRLNGIIELKHRIACNDFYITNIMRLFNGDNPASQLESGEQKNEDCFC